MQGRSSNPQGCVVCADSTKWLNYSIHIPDEPKAGECVVTRAMDCFNIVGYFIKNLNYLRI